MKRIYHHYTKWEDYRSGMFVVNHKQDSELLIRKAQEILSNETKTYKAMKRVINEWPVSCEVNLSHTGLNRQAWLGQACCWLVGKVQDNYTKIAWHQLTIDEQNMANNIADKVIDEWEKNQCPKNLWE